MHGIVGSFVHGRLLTAGGDLIATGTAVFRKAADGDGAR